MSTIYLASSMGTYRTSRYDRMQDSVRSNLGDCLPARTLYLSNAHWIRTWPQILRRVDGLAFFLDRQGWMGRGTHTEIRDALSAGKPVWFLPDIGAPIPMNRIKLIVSGRSWVDYARVCVERT